MLRAAGTRRPPILVPPVPTGMRRGNGRMGWPTLPKLEAIRDQWLHATDLPTQKALAADMQRQAFEDAPAMPLAYSINRWRIVTVWPT
jgi:hypothetical protein